MERKAGLERTDMGLERTGIVLKELTYLERIYRGLERTERFGKDS